MALKKAGRIVTIGVVGEAPQQVVLKANQTVAAALKYLNIALNDGEVLEKDGEVVAKTYKPKNGDIIFITEDDNNG